MLLCRPEEEAVVDYQAVDVGSSAEPSVTLHDDRLRTFETRKTPSLKSDSFVPDLDAGIVPTKSKNSISDSKPAATAEPAKPAIVFRKRKINPEHRKATRKPDAD